MMMSAKTRKRVTVSAAMVALVGLLGSYAVSMI
jgi:hypothetical protein